MLYYLVIIFLYISLQINIMAEEIDFEREYSPSRWSIRFSTPGEVIKYHVEHVTSASLAATNNIPHELDIEYGPTLGQKLDILGTDLPKDAPIFVYIHGGFWQMLSRNISRYAAEPLHHAGIKTIVVGYDLCPTVGLQQIVSEVENAAKYVFQYAENMRSRGVYFAGHSAGAHLVAKILSNASLLANTPGSNRLKGAFLVSGVYSLQELLYTTVNDALNLTDELANTLSPYFDNFAHLKDKEIRINVIAGQHDTSRFKKQSKEFYELLHNKYSLPNVNLDIKDNYDHFDIVECFSNNNNYLKMLLIQDIEKYL
ncbi:kynurenine formamidase isoform X1 [Manduca sexta]|uniref:kynurenine formamidase isoform X1 n=2 Tax=Manduca sexta TaxID=7130 RepID=UPI001890A700|nr:kynurenine formamidase isoform X1 [Manduca sexta]